MSLLAVAAARTPALCLVVLAAAAACGIGFPGQVSPAAMPAAPGSATHAGPPTPTAVPPTPTAVPGQAPPDALLMGTDGGRVAGDLGTFAWDGFVSDSPWIPGPAAGTSVAGGQLRVELRPGARPTAWQASWARLIDGQALPPSSARGPRRGPLTLTAPGAPGRWSLQLFARFGAGREAAWYWQLEVVP